MERECRCASQISKEEWAKIDQIIDKFIGKPGALIPVLEQVQQSFGYLPAEVQRRIAERLDISPAMVYGVVSFYSFFTMLPKGRHTIRVCLGTACYVKRSEEILENIKKTLNIDIGQMTEDGRFSLEGVRCVGACGLAPVVMIGDNAHGHIDPAKATEMLKDYE